jgi:hypothetical protein
MQDSPSKESILLALAKFLQSEARPAVTDQRVAFRLLVAANLCTVLALECDNEEEHDAAELRGLQNLLVDNPAHLPRPRAERLALIKKLNATLAERIRKREYGPDERARYVAHVKKTLADKLSVANPRFDQSPDIP